jgi:hypothetical protein
MEKESAVPTLEVHPPSLENLAAKVKFEKSAVEVAEHSIDIEREPDQEEQADDLPDRLEVRSAVDTTDDVNMPAETFRAYFIGVFFTLLGAASSNVTSLREQPLVIDSGMVQLVSLPVGRFWARYMPEKSIGIGRWRFNLNPGPFTIKEHALIVIMANVGVGWPPYAAGLVIVQVAKFGIFRPKLTDFRPTFWNVIRSSPPPYHGDVGIWLGGSLSALVGLPKGYDLARPA